MVLGFRDVILMMMKQNRRSLNFYIYENPKDSTLRPITDATLGTYLAILPANFLVSITS